MLHPKSMKHPFTLAMAFSTSAVTPKYRQMHLSAFAVTYSLCSRHKKTTESSTLRRMKMRISIWVETPIFLHETWEYYTKIATKAVIRHSKPYSYKNRRLWGKTCSFLSTLVLAYILFITHTNAPQRFSTPPPTDTHTCKNHKPKLQLVTLQWSDVL